MRGRCEADGDHCAKTTHREFEGGGNTAHTASEAVRPRQRRIDARKTFSHRKLHTKLCEIESCTNSGMFNWESGPGTAISLFVLSASGLLCAFACLLLVALSLTTARLLACGCYPLFSPTLVMLSCRCDVKQMSPQTNPTLKAMPW